MSRIPGSFRLSTSQSVVTRTSGFAYPLLFIASNGWAKGDSLRRAASRYSGSIGNGNIGLEQDYVALLRCAAQHQHLAGEAGSPARPQVHCGHHLPADEIRGHIPACELSAGTAMPQLRAEVHQKLDRRLACLRERLCL